MAPEGEGGDQFQRQPAADKAETNRRQYHAE